LKKSTTWPIHPPYHGSKKGDNVREKGKGDRERGRRMGGRRRDGRKKDKGDVRECRGGRSKGEFHSQIGLKIPKNAKLPNDNFHR